MAKTKQMASEREYVINLRREILKVPRYRRTPKAVKAVKQFVAKHMRIPERDLNKVKLDKWLNQELWFRGIQNPITKIKVNVKREGDNVLVSLVELPDKLRFKKEREEKAKQKAEKANKEKKIKEEAEKPKEENKPLGKVSKTENEHSKTEEKTDSEVKEEKEKEVAVAETREKQAEMKAKEQKHMDRIKPAKTERIQRKALQK